MTRLKAIIASAAVLVLFLWLGVFRAELIPQHANREQQLWLLTGDEPAYLLAAQAFAAGDGLDMGPAQRRQEHLRFYDGDIMGPGQFNRAWHGLGGDPTSARARWWADKQIKRHAPGFPLLLAPLAGCQQFRWTAAVTEALLMCALAALLLWRARTLATTTYAATALAVLCFLGGAPSAFYAAQMYPETSTGVLAVTALTLFTARRRWEHLAGCVLLTVLLWFSPRMLGGVLLACGILGWSALRRRDWLELLLLGAGCALFFGFNLFVWDMLLPMSLAGSSKLLALGCGVALVGSALLYKFMRPRWWLVTLLALGGAAFLALQQVSPALTGGGPLKHLGQQLLIMFLGNDVGLLFLNPALWLGVVAACWLLCHQRDEAFYLWAALFIGVLVSVAVVPEWRAGTCPAGRYGVIPAYLLLVPVLRVFALASPAWRVRLLTTLVVLGGVGLVTGWFMAQAPNFWFRDYHPLFGYVRLQRYYDWLPASEHLRPKPILLWLLCFSATLGLFDAGRFLWRWWKNLPPAIGPFPDS